MKEEKKKYLSASAVLIGSCIGAGVLGIPYVASKSGFLTGILYILILGIFIYIVNSFLGEVVLRTKGEHQLIGYTEKYLGRKARHVMEFAFVFGLYSAIIAYMVGMGESLSFLFFKNIDYKIPFGIAVGLFMSFLLKGGIKSLKKFEKIGVTIVLSLFTAIVLIFISKVNPANLTGFYKENIFVPFGVVLFALMSFTSIPEVNFVLKNKKNLMRKVLRTGSIVSVSFYIIFTLVVLGYKGNETPEVATLALGSIFVILGTCTMFTSYLVSGDALRESFKFDERYSEKSSWILATIFPIIIFVLTQLTNFFSFTKILSIGGTVSGGIIAILSLLMVNKAKKHGERKPEYSMKGSWYLIGFLIFIFVFGIIIEFFF